MKKFYHLIAEKASKKGCPTCWTAPFIALAAIVLTILVSCGDDPGGVDDPYYVLTLNGYGRNSQTKAYIHFETEMEGEAYYLVLPGGTKPEPTAATVMDTGTSVGAVSPGIMKTINNVPLMAGQQDVYIVVEDTENNISKPLKVFINEYPYITASSTGLGSLKVGVSVNASIVYTISTYTFSGINPAHFAVNGLPDGLTQADAEFTNMEIVTVKISGAPTTAQAAGNITLPSSIPTGSLHFILEEAVTVTPTTIPYSAITGP